MKDIDIWQQALDRIEGKSTECGHQWVFHSENYGADRDGNRGVLQEGYECQKCGEWKR